MQSQDPAPGEPRIPLSVIVLERASRTDEPPDLEQLLADALEISVSRAAGVGDATLGAGHPNHRLRIDDQVYRIEFSAQPLEDVVQAAGSIRDPQMRRVASDHAGAIVISAVTDVRDEAERATDLRRLARIASALLAETSVAIRFSTDARLFPVVESTRTALRDEDPVAACAKLSAPPVVGVDDADPELVAATLRARERWAQFAGAFARIGPEAGSCHVKVPLCEGDIVEHVWITVTGMDANKVCGRIANEPVDLAGVAMGAEVTHPIAGIDDWMFVDDEGRHGGFTVALLRSRYEAARPPSDVRDADSGTVNGEP